jgi:hypothetical protein
MSRILKRPMFRKGGPTNEGIVSMAQPRKNYNKGGKTIQEQLIERFPEMANTIKTGEGKAALLTAFAGQGRSQNDRVSDLLIKGGMNLASGKPQGNIVATIAESFKEPTSQFLKERQTEDAFKRQARLQGITSAMASEDAIKLARAKLKQKSYQNQTPEAQAEQFLKLKGSLFKNAFTKQAQAEAKKDYDKTYQVYPQIKQGFKADVGIQIAPVDTITELREWIVTQPENSKFIDPISRKWKMVATDPATGKKGLILLDQITLKEIK